MQIRRLLVLIRALPVLFLAIPATALAQRPEITHDTHHDVSPPLRDIPPIPQHRGRLEAEPVRHIPSSRKLPFGPDPVVQGTLPSTAALLAPTLSNNFTGIGNGFAGFSVGSAPPDNNSAVGPNHIVETVNTDFAVFSKTGQLLHGPTSINTLWSGFGGACQVNNDGDPTVSYDRIADRWVIAQFSVSTVPYLQCVAVSTTADPTGSYYRYSFNYGTTAFPDYPKMGVWPDAYYETYNIFNNGLTFAGAKVCAFDRSKMLTGAAATQVCFDTGPTFGGLLPADLDGRTLPPAGAPNAVVALGATSTTLALWKFHVDFTTPANSTFAGPTALTVPAYDEACASSISGTCIPQAGGGQLDSLSDRLMYRAAYRNFADHEAIVVNHSVTAGSSVGIRWYELRGVTTTPTLFQAGTYAPDSTYRWMGSAAMDQSGNIAVGYSASSSAIKPQIRVTGRLAGDAAGVLTQGETTVIAGGGAQGATLTRWGDYTSMAIDPVDDCTFWYTNQYLQADGTFNWSTRIASFKLPQCGVPTDFSLSASPNALSLMPGAMGASTILVAPSGAFAGAVALSVIGVPAGATASFSSTTTTSTSLLTINAGTAAVGTYPLTVTGTSGALTHTTTVTLTVVPPPDFALSASAASVSAVQGGNTTTTMTVTPQNGFTGLVDLSVSGLPAGATGSFNPVSTTTTSVLTLGAGTAAPGTYVLTVTGVNGALTHSTRVTFVVTAAPQALFSIFASPPERHIKAGKRGICRITITRAAGFTGAVDLSVSGEGIGVTATFDPASVTDTTSILTITTHPIARRGVTMLIITGRSAGALDRSTSVALTIH